MNTIRLVLPIVIIFWMIFNIGAVIYSIDLIINNKFYPDDLFVTDIYETTKLNIAGCVFVWLFLLM